jgi:hypothetical protein
MQLQHAEALATNKSLSHIAHLLINPSDIVDRLDTIRASPVVADLAFLEFIFVFHAAVYTFIAHLQRLKLSPLKWVLIPLPSERAFGFDGQFITSW